MAFAKQSVCRRCKRSIEWATHAQNGRRIPIDPVQVDRSKDPFADVAWYIDPVTDEEMVRKITPEEPVDPNPEVERHARRHFVSCSAGGSHHDSAPMSVAATGVES